MTSASDPTPTPRLGDHGQTVGRDLAFFALAVLALLPSVWSMASISGQDEYWLSFRTVLEMQDRGEWLTPYIDGAARLKKPPLLYWLMLAGFKTIGASPLAARLPSVLFGAGFALASNRVHGLLGGRGYLVGVMALASAGVAIESRRAMFDLPLACLVTAALYLAIVWWRRGGFARAASTGAMLAAAAMMKGPVALWFFAAPLLAVLPFRRKEPVGARFCELPVLLLAFAALALPWPIAIAQLHPEFWDTMDEQVANREFGGFDPARIGKLLGGALGLVVPWALLVLDGAVAAARGRGEHRSERRMLLVWFVVGAVPFAFMKTFERYMLALLCPMLALAVHRFVELSSRARRVHLMIAVGLLTVPAAGFALFVLWFGLALWAPLVGLVVLALAWRTASRDPDRPLRTAIALAATMMVLLGGVYPSIGINALPDDLPADLATTPVATFARSQPGMLSIATGHSVRQLDLDADGRATALRGFSGYVFVADEDAARFEAALAADGIRCERRGEFRSFYSRKTWLKFQRPGIGWSEWKQALTDRSTEVLQPVFVYYRLPGTD